jgi:hypothetical protein
MRLSEIAENDGDSLRAGDSCWGQYERAHKPRHDAQPNGGRPQNLCLPLIRPIGSRRPPQVFVMEPTHALHTLPEGVTVYCVAVAEEVGRCGVVGEGVHDLLGGPVGGGMLGHVEMDDPAAVVGEHDENEEHAQACGGDREEVEGNEIADMVGKERAPSL